MTSEIIKKYGTPLMSRKEFANVELRDVEAAGRTLGVVDYSPMSRMYNACIRVITQHKPTIADLAAWESKRIANDVVGMGARSIPQLNELLEASREHQLRRSKRS